MPLPHQAAKVLLALLDSRGEVVSREALRQVLWPDKVSGEFESGINVAIRKLRKALQDEGVDPVLIGTLPTHGYRMLVPVEALEDGPEAPGAAGVPLAVPSAGDSALPVAGITHPSERGPAAGSTFIRVQLDRIHSISLELRLVGITLILLAAGLLYLVLGNSGLQPGRTPGETMKDEVSGMTFVWVPPGTFTMGSPPNEPYHKRDEGPQWKVTISQGFWMGKFEVTQGQYESLVGTNPSEFKEVGPTAPVENVSWDDAQAFLGKLNQRASDRLYRLPTEAEWEYACRAGTTGSTYGPLNTIAWHWSNSGESTSPVNRKRSKNWSGNTTHPTGQKQPNAWGLHDMIGNVWEWCQDWYRDPYDTELETDPVGPAIGEWRAIRGASWGDDPTICRAAYRATGYYPETRIASAGFRVVCVPKMKRPE